MILKKLYKLVEKMGPRSLRVRSATEYALCLYSLLGLGRKPQQRFAIFMQARSGSSFFCDLLDQHPKIRCNSELLNQKSQKPLRFLNHVSNYYGKKNPVWGFKFKSYQVHRQGTIIDDFIKQLLDSDYKIISLTRENSLKMALSFWIAHLRGEDYHNIGGQIERKKVTVDVKELMDSIEYIEIDRERMMKSLVNIETLDLVYEDDLQDPGKAVKSCQKTFGFLGVEPIEVQSKFKKLSTGRLSDDLENAEEVYNFIKESKYAHFLEGISL